MSKSTSNQEGSPLKKWSAVCYNYKALQTSEAAAEHAASGCTEVVGSIDSSSGDCADQYEFCMVFPANKGILQDSGKSMVQSLFKLGFEIKFYRGMKETEIMVLLKLPLDIARAYAESEIDMLLDEHQAEVLLQRGDPENNIAPATIVHRPEITAIRPCQFIYAPYCRRLEHLYQHDDTSAEAPTHPFKELLRLKICAMLLQSRLPDGTDGLHIRKAITEKKLLACFPLHSPAKVTELQELWGQYPYDALPLDAIKEYFGEKVGLYFAFADHLSTALVYPALVGIPLQAYVFFHGSLSDPYLALFAFCVALWAVIMLEYWKRKEKLLSLQWGTIQYETYEVDRPEFQGELIASYIDGSPMLYYPSHQRAYYITQSMLGVSLLLMLALSVVVSIYLIRFTIEDHVGIVTAQIMASAANSVQIQVMNFLYAQVLKYLTDRENHRTDTQYEDSMIVKIFIFLFVNSYASFYYLAFLAENLGDCPVHGCMHALAINLAVVFGSSLASSAFLQLLLPYVQYQYSYYHVAGGGASSASSAGVCGGGADTETDDHKYSSGANPGSKTAKRISRPEREHLLATYDQLSATTDDYSELAVGFGYTALFVAALPIAALCYLLYSTLQIKGDGWKLLHLYKRPFPRGCEDIGTWQSVFLIITAASVVTNAGLAVFTMQNLDSCSTTTRYWCFIAFQWVCFSLQAFIMAWIPDMPEEIEIQLQRAAFIKRKLIDRLPDEGTAGVPRASGATGATGNSTAGAVSSRGSAGVGKSSEACAEKGKEYPIVYTEYIGASANK